MSCSSDAQTDGSDQLHLEARTIKILEQDGKQFKDLNKNGELDPYEDWRRYFFLS